MSTPSWTDLFSTEQPADVSVDLRVLKKRGEPFLILPRDPELAAKSLSLYPAQRPKAKFAKKMLGAVLSTGLPLPLNRASLQISTRDPFARFLMQLAGGRTPVFPTFAIFAGSPHAKQRRFLLLVFDEQKQPLFVVKVGTSEAARRLVHSESSFLQRMKGISGLPKFFGSLVNERVEALASEYVEGESPRGEDRPVIVKLMEQWLEHGQTIRMVDVPAWQTLEKSPAAAAIVGHLRDKLAKFTFRSTLFHGDFAPWNIKVSSRDGSWRVIDWERGELIGFPAWDWFHYVTQTGILVHKLDAKASLRRLDNLLADLAFQRYAEIAGIKGKEKLLAIMYLSHLVHIIQPGEGLETNRALLPLLCARFL